MTSQDRGADSKGLSDCTVAEIEAMDGCDLSPDMVAKIQEALGEGVSARFWIEH